VPRSVLALLGLCWRRQWRARHAHSRLFFFHCMSKSAVPSRHCFARAPAGAVRAFDAPMPHELARRAPSQRVWGDKGGYRQRLELRNHGLQRCRKRHTYITPHGQPAAPRLRVGGGKRGCRRRGQARVGTGRANAAVSFAGTRPRPGAQQRFAVLAWSAFNHLTDATPSRLIELGPAGLRIAAIRPGNDTCAGWHGRPAVSMYERCRAREARGRKRRAWLQGGWAVEMASAEISVD
jgi:hypothetical protein